MKHYLFSILIVGLVFSGCSKKDSVPKPIEVPKAVDTASELPVLDQNNLYLTNRPEPYEAPDYSHSSNTPSDNQEPPPGTKLSPLID